MKYMLILSLLVLAGCWDNAKQYKDECEALAQTQCPSAHVERKISRRRYVIRGCGRTWLAEYGSWCDACSYSCRLRSEKLPTERSEK